MFSRRLFAWTFKVHSYGTDENSTNAIGICLERFIQRSDEDVPFPCRSMEMEPFLKWMHRYHFYCEYTEWAMGKMHRSIYRRREREKFNRVNSIDRAWQSVWRYRRASSNNKTKQKAKSIVRLAHECMCTSDRVITCTICYLFHLTLATAMFVLLLHKTRKFRIKMHDSNKISGTNWNEMKKMILWSHLISRASGAFYISTMWSTNACNGHREEKSEWVSERERDKGTVEVLTRG